MRIVTLRFVALVTLTIAVQAVAAGDDRRERPRCLYIGSYHQGYEWADGQQAGLERTLAGHCELRVFRLDAKRHPERVRERAREALALIGRYNPDVVIACDDAASQEIIVPYFRNADTPFVFCGINWTVDRYGYPYDNVTGMVESSPIRPMLDLVRRALPAARRGVFLSGEAQSDRLELIGIRRAFREVGITLDSVFVTDMGAWVSAFRRAQARADFLIVHNNARIADWDADLAARTAFADGRRLSLTLNRWLMPVAMIGVLKVPEEQGEWAGLAALAILGGKPPSAIPIVSNRRWDMLVNPRLLNGAGIALPEGYARRAARYDDDSGGGGAR